MYRKILAVGVLVGKSLYKRPIDLFFTPHLMRSITLGGRRSSSVTANENYIDSNNAEHRVSDLEAEDSYFVHDSSGVSIVMTEQELNAFLIEEGLDTQSDLFSRNEASRFVTILDPSVSLSPLRIDFSK